MIFFNKALGRPSRLFSRSGLQFACVILLSACGGSGTDEAPSAAVPPIPPVQSESALTCTSLASRASGGLVGNRDVVQSTIVTTIVPPDPGGYFSGSTNPTASGGGGSVPPTPSYCDVQFTYGTGLEGPKDGYDQGQAQLIKIRVLLPLNEADGGAGGVQGNWNGKQMVGASGGSSNDQLRWASFAEGVVDDDIQYSVRLGYVGSNTDTGQSNPPFGFISTGALAGTLAVGTIEDWAARGTSYGKRMAASLASVYYGKTPSRTYYNGCSGAGNQGLGQLQRFGDEYDGALIGAPAIYWQQFRLADSWPQLVWKKHVQKGGIIPTTAQRNAATASAIAACDVSSSDTVADGLIADPRACTFSAKANVCGQAGAPGAGSCLSVDQADAVDRIWEGPRNKHGKRIWFPYDKGISISGSSTISGSTQQVIQWNHKDASLTGSLLFADAESMALAGNPTGGLTYEDEATLGSTTVSDYSDNQGFPQDSFRAKGGKIIHIHGMADGAIRWRHSADYYRRVATHFGNGKADMTALSSWYRFFPMPSVGHCVGGAGPNATDPFLALVDWVENGRAPSSLLGSSHPAGASVSRTRPLCPYPQTSLYKGVGDVNNAASYSCGGNLETQQVLCDMVRTRTKGENQNTLDYASIGVDPVMCLSRLASP